MGTAPTEVKGTQHHFTRNGRLVANKQLVFQINQEVGMESVSYLFLRNPFLGGGVGGVFKESDFSSCPFYYMMHSAKARGEPNRTELKS